MLSDVLLDFGQSFHSVILIRQLLDSLIGSLQASPDPRFPINAMNSGLFPHKAIESSFLGRIFTLFFAPSQSGNRRESHLRAKSAAGAAWTDSGICKPCWSHSTAPATDHAKIALRKFVSWRIRILKFQSNFTSGSAVRSLSKGISMYRRLPLSFIMMLREEVPIRQALSPTPSGAAGPDPLATPILTACRLTSTSVRRPHGSTVGRFRLAD
jgi:hypothetical protein